MLRIDNKAQLVKLPWTLARMISGRRYAAQSVDFPRFRRHLLT